MGRSIAAWPLNKGVCVGSGGTMGWTRTIPVTV